MDSELKRRKWDTQRPKYFHPKNPVVVIRHFSHVFKDVVGEFLRGIGIGFNHGYLSLSRRDFCLNGFKKVFLACSRERSTEFILELIWQNTELLDRPQEPPLDRNAITTDLQHLWRVIEIILSDLDRVLVDKLSSLDVPAFVPIFSKLSQSNFLRLSFIYGQFG